MGGLVSRVGLAAQPRSPSVTPTVRAAVPSPPVPLARPVHPTHQSSRCRADRARARTSTGSTVYRRRPHVVYAYRRRFFRCYCRTTVCTVIIIFTQYCCVRVNVFEVQCAINETTLSNAANNRGVWYVVGARMILFLFLRLKIFLFK